MNTVAKVQGVVISIADLPPSNNMRWTALRKRIIVYAVEGGLIGVEDCEKRWGISADEFHTWRSMFYAHGANGLKVTKCQELR